MTGSLYDEGTCSVCGRATYRYGMTYTLGRRGGAAIRQWDRWRHKDGGALECQRPAPGDDDDDDGARFHA